MRSISLALMMMNQKLPFISNNNANNMFISSNIEFMNNFTCEFDFDCELPFKCCDRIFFKYCCTDGGLGEKIKSKKFPNVTIPPLHIPLPLPLPVPDPLPG